MRALGEPVRVGGQVVEAWIGVAEAAGHVRGAVVLIGDPGRGDGLDGAHPGVVGGQRGRAGVGVGHRPTDGE
ncbi:hypothetical protein AB0N16_28765 [Streptomyces sp. NPDC051105]|uniref:hypothetical protein n=1 Tax=Streptomyces sp. NPDC051105 TaxID=3154843 RepID=UPI00341BAB0C